VGPIDAIRSYVDQFVELFAQFDVPAAFWVTLQLTFFAGVGSLVVGTVLALMRISPVPSLRWAGTSYVNVLRNTPLTVIILFCNLGLFVQLGVTLASPTSSTFFIDNNFRLAVLGLTVYHAAFVCEALRSGVNTVPVGQAEAARAIGLSFLPAARLIIFPQAFRGAIAPLGNTLIALTKNTTVVATIGVAELAYQMRNMIEFSPSLLYPIFILIAVCFIALTLPTGLLFTYLSRRLVVQR